MSSKSEVLAKVINTNTYIGSAVKMMINEVTCEDSPTVPNTLRKGDVIKVRINKDGTPKPRPSIVIKVTKNYVVTIPLTSAENENALCASYGSRFFKDCFFCNTYVIIQIDIAKEGFLGVYDSNKSLNNAIKELRIFISKNI